MEQSRRDAVALEAPFHTPLMQAGKIPESAPVLLKVAEALNDEYDRLINKRDKLRERNKVLDKEMKMNEILEIKYTNTITYFEGVCGQTTDCLTDYENKRIELFKED